MTEPSASYTADCSCCMKTGVFVVTVSVVFYDFVLALSPLRAGTPHCLTAGPRIFLFFTLNQVKDLEYVRNKALLKNKSYFPHSQYFFPKGFLL